MEPTGADQFPADVSEPISHSRAPEERKPFSLKNDSVKQQGFGERSAGQYDSLIPRPDTKIIAGGRTESFESDRKIKPEETEEKQVPGTAEAGPDRSGPFISAIDYKPGQKVESFGARPAAETEEKGRLQGSETTPPTRQQKTAKNERTIKDVLRTEGQRREPEEKIYSTLRADHFRLEHEGKKRATSGKNSALKALFTEESRDQAHDEPIARRIRTNTTNTMEKSPDMAEAEKETLKDNKTGDEPADEEMRRLVSPQKTQSYQAASAPRDQDQKEQRKTVTSVDRTSRGENNRALIGDIIGRDGIAVKRLSPGSGFPSGQRETESRKEPSNKRQGTVKIGNVNIVLKGKDKTENQVEWPEAPVYADHAITEDWEWSWRYGR